MTEKTKAELTAEIEQLEADLAFYKRFADVVRKKSRAMPDVGDALFNIIRQYQRKLKEEANR